MNKTLRLALLFTSMCVICIPTIWAQVGPPGSTGGNPIPIDGGVVTVVGAGLLYGAKKLYDRNKSDNNQ